MTPRRAASAAVATISLVAMATPAWGAPGPGTGSGSIGPGSIGAVAGAPGGPGGDEPVSFTPSPANAPPSTQSGYTWIDDGADLYMTCTNGVPTPAGTPDGTSLGPPGTPNIPELYSLIGPNGQAIATKDVCPGTLAAIVPPPPPAPPAPAEVWAATRLPTPIFDFNPPRVGLTQLATWFWLTGIGGQVTATVTIRGYTVVTTAYPADYYWHFGDGTGTTSASPGNQNSPSATHTYTTKGSYPVEMTIGWTARYTFTGNGVAAQTVQLGTIDGPAKGANYGVQEVRSVGVAQ